MRALTLLAAAIALAPSALRAECMAIAPFVAGPEAVPPNPRLILFWPREYYPKAPRLTVRDRAGRPLAFTLERLSSSRAYDAYALKVVAAGGARLTVEGDAEHPRFKFKRSFRVDDAWKRPAAAPWEYAVKTSTYSWPCSFERIRTLSIPAGPAAYRADWKPARGGRGGSVVVPAQSVWFHYGPAAARPARAEIKLGHVNCAGWNFRWDDPAIDLVLVGLHPDGSEEPLPAVRLEAPPRLGAEARMMPDTPDDLTSPQSAWESLLSALQAGRADALRRVTTPAGLAALNRALGQDPARLAQVSDGWGAAPIRWGAATATKAEARWGPEIKEHSFRFARVKEQWRLDGWTAGD